MPKTLSSHVTFDRLTPEEVLQVQARHPSLDSLFAWLDVEPRVDAYSRDDWGLVLIIERPYFDMGSSHEPCIEDDLRAAFPDLTLNIVVHPQPGHAGSYTWRRVLRVYVRQHDGLWRKLP